MTEQVFKLSGGDNKVIEKVLLDENINYLHMILGEGDSLPEHYTNSNVYMTVVRGMLSIALEGGPIREYEAGTLLKIPDKSLMNVKNRHTGTLELIVVKSPAPTALR